MFFKYACLMLQCMSATQGKVCGQTHAFNLFIDATMSIQGKVWNQTHAFKHAGQCMNTIQGKVCGQTHALPPDGARADNC